MLKPPTMQPRSQLEDLTKALDEMTMARPAAVQVLSYELRCAMLGDLPALQDSAQRTAPPAAGAD